MANYDPITTEILRNKLDAVVDEMKATLVNTAYSRAISLSGACAAGIFTEARELVAVDNPLYMYPLSETLASAIDFFQYDLTADDVLLTNDPYGGGTKVQEFTLILPVASDDNIILYLAVRGQTEDFGGDLRGNINPRAEDIWAEGVRCTPVKLYRDGKLCKDTLNTLCLNSRSPDALKLDFEAMLASVRIGSLRINELVSEYGAEKLLQSAGWVLDYAETHARELIAALGDGRYSSSAMMAHDCKGRENLKIQATVQVIGGDVVVDFDGTEQQSPAFVNCPLVVTKSLVFLALQAALAEDLLSNAGVMRTISINAPAGSLVNPAFPAPIGWGTHHAGHECAKAVLAAFNGFVASPIPNITADQMLLFCIHRDIKHGQTVEQVGFVDYATLLQGGGGAALEVDGWGMPGAAAATPLPSIEMFEGEHDVLVEELEFSTDSGGAGKWRGGLGTRTRLSLLEPRTGTLSLTACVMTEVGIDGSSVSELSILQNSVVISSPSGLRRVDDAIVDVLLEGDASLEFYMSGGNGCGPASERDPIAVLTDYNDELISLEAARDFYKVVIDPMTKQINEDATRHARGG